LRLKEALLELLRHHARAGLDQAGSEREEGSSPLGLGVLHPLGPDSQLLGVGLLDRATLFLQVRNASLHGLARAVSRVPDALRLVEGCLGSGQRLATFREDLREVLDLLGVFGQRRACLRACGGAGDILHVAQLNLGSLEGSPGPLQGTFGLIQALRGRIDLGTRAGFLAPLGVDLLVDHRHPLFQLQISFAQRLLPRRSLLFDLQKRLEQRGHLPGRLDGRPHLLRQVRQAVVTRPLRQRRGLPGQVDPSLQVPLAARHAQRIGWKLPKLVGHRAEVREHRQIVHVEHRLLPIRRWGLLPWRTHGLQGRLRNTRPGGRSLALLGWKRFSRADVELERQPTGGGLERVSTEGVGPPLRAERFHRTRKVQSPGLIVIVEGIERRKAARRDRRVLVRGLATQGTDVVSAWGASLAPWADGHSWGW
jgi:hypothetical protein